MGPGSLEQDLARRDFTVNAMAFALAPDQWSQVLDPVGGRRDLDAKLVRAMRRGKKLMIRGVSQRGTKTTDRFSLTGFTAAHKAISKACKAK